MEKTLELTLLQEVINLIHSELILLAKRSLNLEKIVKQTIQVAKMKILLIVGNKMNNLLQTLCRLEKKLRQAF